MNLDTFEARRAVVKNVVMKQENTKTLAETSTNASSTSEKLQRGEGVGKGEKVRTGASEWLVEFAEFAEFAGCTPRRSHLVGG